MPPQCAPPSLARRHPSSIDAGHLPQPPREPAAPPPSALLPHSPVAAVAPNPAKASQPAHQPPAMPHPPPPATTPRQPPHTSQPAPHSPARRRLFINGFCGESDMHHRLGAKQAWGFDRALDARADVLTGAFQAHLLASAASTGVAAAAVPCGTFSPLLRRQHGRMGNQPPPVRSSGGVPAPDGLPLHQIPVRWQGWLRAANDAIGFT